MKTGEVIKEFTVITLATLIVAASVFFFLVPSHVTVGSITGLAVVLTNFVPLKVSAITMIMNVFLLLIGFIFIGKDFGGKTVYTSMLLPVFLAIFEIIFPNMQSLTNDAFIDTIAYVFLVSVGLAMLFNRNASSGGLDIVAKLLNKYFRMDLGKAMSLAGMCAALTSAFVYDSKIVVLSLLGTYLNGIVLDHFIFGFNEKKRICIISNKEDEIKEFILHTLHSGATIYEARGAFNNEIRREIIAIVTKNEYAQLMNFISKTDKDAFVTVYAVNEVIYRPKVF